MQIEYLIMCFNFMTRYAQEISFFDFVSGVRIKIVPTLISYIHNNIASNTLNIINDALFLCPVFVTDDICNSGS